MVPFHELTCERAKLAELRTYHANPRAGNVELIRQSLVVNGQYRPIVVNRGTYTNRANEVLAGNHTLMAAREEGWSEIAVAWVDVDDDQCARIVLADNRTADVGSYDDRLLVELLSSLPNLDGTGYDPGDIDELARTLEVPTFEPVTDEEARLDRKAITTCPECGHVFIPITRRVLDEDSVPWEH